MYAATRDRTRDLQIFSLTLSQLSYSGVKEHAASLGCNAAPRALVGKKVKDIPGGT